MIPAHDLVGDMQDVTVGATVSTVAVPARANGVLIQTKTANVKATTDGSTPSATHGFLVVADAVPLFLPLSSRRFSLKMIRSASTDAPTTLQWVRAKNRY